MFTPFVRWSFPKMPNAHPETETQHNSVNLSKRAIRFSTEVKKYNLQSPPECFLDTITHEPFENPIKVPCCKRIFERSILLKWIRDNSTNKDCPYCRAPVDEKQLEPVPYLQEAHEEWQKMFNTANRLLRDNIALRNNIKDEILVPYPFSFGSDEHSIINISDTTLVSLLDLGNICMNDENFGQALQLYSLAMKHADDILKSIMVYEPYTLVLQLQEDPNLSQALVWLAKLYQNNKNIEKAVQTLNEALVSDPDNKEATKLLNSLTNKTNST